jgi:GAF domain-containing protein
MALRTWVPLSPEEHARRHALLRTILTVQTFGFMLGGSFAVATWLMTPSLAGLLSSLMPFLVAGMCWLAYLWSKRHWYPAVYFYQAITLFVTVVGLYSFGGATGPMGIFFLWIILTGGMLIDLRASVELAGLSIILYGFFAVGVPLGWIHVEVERYSLVATYAFPIFLIMMFALVAFLTRLFGGSLEEALARARRLASDLANSAEQLTETNRQITEANRQFQELAERHQRRALRLQAGAEVAGAASTLLDPDRLIAQAVDLIRARFEFYYVGLFLLDADGRFAVLQQGTGEAGRVMKGAGHRLEVGGQSMVGWACANKRPRVALDVGLEAVRFASPLLPDTHSEMALPLRVGDRVLGALDVQSTQKAAFDEDDITTLQGMANQIAVALENARLFQQSETALKELETANQLLAREGWQGHLSLPTATRRAEFRPARMPATRLLSQPLTLPLELRGQRIGRLLISREGRSDWSDDEIETIQAIALQTALAADNARLIEQTQRALDETRALYETGREITSAGEISEVLSAVLDNLARTGVHGSAIAMFDAPTREQATHFEVAATWDHLGTLRMRLGTRFPIASFPFFNRITSSAALVSQDLMADPQIDDMAKQVLGGMGFRAVAITPLSARGQWIGVLFVLVEQPHQFTPAELDFHHALADQAAVAIDSRRLLAETQRRAQREHQIYEITSRIRRSPDIATILRTTVEELGRALHTDRAMVRLAVKPDGEREE